MASDIDHTARSAVEAVDHQAVGPSGTSGGGPELDRRRPSGPSVEDSLRDELELVRTQLLGAVDAARGAEAEKANALGLVRDLEYQVHMLDVELTELRSRLNDRSRFDRGQLATGRAVAGRLTATVTERLTGPRRRFASRSEVRAEADEVR